MVEHSAVNRVVAGSSPARGAQSVRGMTLEKPVDISVYGLFTAEETIYKNRKRANARTPIQNFLVYKYFAVSGGADKSL